MPGLRIVIGVAAATSLIVSLAVGLLLAPDAAEERSALSVPAREKASARDSGDRAERVELADLADLRNELDQARRSRQVMARQIDELREKLVLAEGGAAPDGVRSQPAGRRLAVTQPAYEAETAPEFAELWFSEDALRELGLSGREAERLRQLFDDVELEKLEARDRALREGWSSSSRHSRELREISTGFREELSDADYDRVLYASGRKNRVRVGDLLRGSAAEKSGVEVGDIVMRYGGERVFDPTTLYLQTTQGDFGENIELEVMRDNEIVRLVVPRGPLGGKMDHFVASPDG